MHTSARTLLARATTAPRPPLLREVYGRLLRGLRTRQGRTLAEVSTAAGVSLAYLSEVERGLKEPSSEMLEAICVALGSSIVSLVGAAHRDLSGSDGVVLDLTTALQGGPEGGRDLAGRPLDEPGIRTDLTMMALLAA